MHVYTVPSGSREEKRGENDLDLHVLGKHEICICITAPAYLALSLPCRVLRCCYLIGPYGDEPSGYHLWGYKGATHGFFVE